MSGFNHNAPDAVDLGSFGPDCRCWLCAPVKGDEALVEYLGRTYGRSGNYTTWPEWLAFKRALHRDGLPAALAAHPPTSFSLDPSRGGYDAAQLGPDFTPPTRSTAP